MAGGGLAGGGAGLVSAASLGRVARDPMNLILTEAAIKGRKGCGGTGERRYEEYRGDLVMTRVQSQGCRYMALRAPYVLPATTSRSLARRRR